MFTLGVDLRCLPMDGSAGRGIEHSARELWFTLCELAPLFGVACVGFAPRGAALTHEDAVIRLPGARGKDLRSQLQTHPVNALLVPSGAVPWGVRVPTYPWVHDCAIFEHPEWFPQSWLQRQMTTRLFLRGLKHAEHIFVISNSSRHEVEKLLPEVTGRLTVTGQGVVVRDEQNVTPLLSDPYALMLGPTEMRKNVSFIRGLWPKVQRRLKEKKLELVIAGRTGWDDECDEGDAPHIRRLRQVSDRDRDVLLQHASMLLVPSLHEGFSRVALEGMSYGVPVLASDRAAIPEVVGYGGRCLPLEDLEKWIQAIVEMAETGLFWEEQKQRAFLRSMDFSWQKTAQIMLAKICER